jgi:flagellar hook-length control protein FliK
LASIRRLATERPAQGGEVLDKTSTPLLPTPNETPSVTPLDLDDASPDLPGTADPVTSTDATNTTTDVGPDVDAPVRPASGEPVAASATLAATPTMTSSPRGGADHVSRPEELPRVVVHQLGDLARDGSNRRIVLRLDPPDLGEVILEVRHRNDDVSVVMRADNADAVRALNREHAEVQRAIQNLGFELGEFDVSARNGDPERHRQGRTRSAGRGALFSPAPHLDQPTGAREGVLLL